MPSSDWKHASRAARLGALCGLGPSLILAVWYAVQNHHLPLPWMRIGATAALIGTFTGAALGGCVQLLVSRAGHVRGAMRLIANPITAGLVGGAIASILAGVFAIAVFGSYRGPYVGSVESGAMLIAACASLGTILSVDAARGAGAGSLGDLLPAFGRVILAAVITGAVMLGVVVLVAPSIFADGIFWTARYVVYGHGAITAGIILGISIGAIFGMFLGLSIWLGRRAAR